MKRLASPCRCPPHPHPREVISAKEKSKYKFPPAALPCEFSAFFGGQAPPLPHRAPPGPAPKPEPFPQFPVPYAGQGPLRGGCTWGWKNLATLRGFRAERIERARPGKINNFWVVAKASHQVGASISLSPFLPSPGSPPRTTGTRL